MTELTPALLQQSLYDMLQSAGVFVPENNQNASCSLIIGLSGGVDSVVLLHALSVIKSNENQIQLKAVHINHQLQSPADEWQAFCVSLCNKLNVPLTCIKVDARPMKGEGPEAAARQARYVAFKTLMQADDVLLTAHHRDDQVETVLLQMLRGTGVAGAAGIAPVTAFNHSYLIRPLLMFDRNSIEQYAQKNKLEWVDDPSNNETTYDRNYLRHQVFPAIEKRWPAYRNTLGRFAQNMRQASELLLQIAEQDLLSVYLFQDRKIISVEKLKQYSLPRQHNILRQWINVSGFLMPSMNVMKQIYAAIVAKNDATPCVSWGDVELRRFKNGLYLLQKNPNNIADGYCLGLNYWHQDTQVEIPGVGFLMLVPSENNGIKNKYFESHHIQIKFRVGGEKCKPQARHKTQTLKKLFQEYNVPPWLRDTTPIVFIDGEIAAVVNVFYCSPFAVNGENNELESVQENRVSNDGGLEIKLIKQ